MGAGRSVVLSTGQSCAAKQPAENVMEAALRLVAELRAEEAARNAEETEPPTLSCVQCWQPITDEASYVPEGCGHILHATCAHLLICSALEKGKSELLCSVSGCDGFFTYNDVCQIAPGLEESYKRIIGSSISGDSKVVTCPMCYEQIMVDPVQKLQCPFCAAVMCAECAQLGSCCTCGPISSHCFICKMPGGTSECQGAHLCAGCKVLVEGV